MRVQRLLMVGAVAAVIALATLAAVVALAVIPVNGYSARVQPSVGERVLARATRRLAIPRASRNLTNPLPFSSEVWAESRAHFADHCATCHANDGSGSTEIGQNLYPKAPDMRLADTQNLGDGELYWIIENGVRLTGMPAWGTGGDNDPDTWKLVHFVRRLKDLRPEQLKEMEALNPKSPAELKEEQEDQQFLAGDDVEAPSSGTTHHHEKEKP